MSDLHPVIEAAAEFLKDEGGRKRKRKSEEERAAIASIIAAHRDHRLTMGSDPADVQRDAAVRGAAAVDPFGYTDTFEAAAVSVIVDILHAVAQRGGNPQRAITESVTYYAEERG